MEMKLRLVFGVTFTIHAFVYFRAHTFIPSIIFKHWHWVLVELVGEAIGGEVTEESKDRDNCATMM